MFQTNDYMAQEIARAQRHFWHVFAAAILLFAGPVASIAGAQDRSLDDLGKLNQSVDALIKKVSPSVVQILVTGYGPLEEGDRGSASTIIGRQRAIGSGFVVEGTGYIMTNAHVVNGAQRVQVVCQILASRARWKPRFPRELALFPLKLSAYRGNSIWR